MPDDLGGDRKELRTILPADAVHADEAQIGFVDESGGLKRVLGTLVIHPLLGDPAELVIYEAQ